MRSTQSSRSRAISCSQILITRQPARLSRWKFLRSRLRFLAIFLRQYGERRPHQVGNLQPCQKSPSMNTTTRVLVNTISGRPASDITCVRYRSPRAKAQRRMLSSGEVFMPRIRDMFQLRCAGVRWSTILHRALETGNLDGEAVCRQNSRRHSCQQSVQQHAALREWLFEVDKWITRLSMLPEVSRELA